MRNIRIYDTPFSLKCKFLVKKDKKSTKIDNDFYKIRYNICEMKGYIPDEERE